MRLFLRLLGPAVLALVVTGCSDGSSDRDDQPQQDNQITTPKQPDPGTGSGTSVRGPMQATPECEAAWQKYKAGYTQGMVKAYETTTNTKKSGSTEMESKRYWRESVTALENANIAIERIEKTIAPTETPEKKTQRTITRNDHVYDCLAATTTTGGTTPNIEVLEERRESVTVAAGTYEANYLKTRETGTDGGSPYEYVSESWYLVGETPVLLKSVAKWTTTMNRAPFEQSVVTELVEFSLP